jgi:hypothetical protein
VRQQATAFLPAQRACPTCAERAVSRITRRSACLRCSAS